MVKCTFSLADKDDPIFTGRFMISSKNQPQGSATPTKSKPERREPNKLSRVEEKPGTKVLRTDL
jgi:hypothetical protein